MRTLLGHQGEVRRRGAVASAGREVNEVLGKLAAHNLCCLVKAIFTAGLAPVFWKDAAPLPAAPTLALVTP